MRGGLLLALLLAGVLLAALGSMLHSRTRTGDYPAAIMVDGTVYLVPVDPLPAGTVDEGEITGHVGSYTETFPEKDGQQNFSRRADLPCIRTAEGIALLYDGAWYLCVPARYDEDGMTHCPAETAPRVPGHCRSLLDFSHADYIIGTVPPGHHPLEGNERGGT